MYKKKREGQHSYLLYKEAGIVQPSLHVFIQLYLFKCQSPELYIKNKLQFKHKTKEILQSVLTKLSGNNITSDCFLIIVLLSTFYPKIIDTITEFIISIIHRYLLNQNNAGRYIVRQIIFLKYELHYV